MFKKISILVVVVVTTVSCTSNQCSQGSVCTISKVSMSLPSSFSTPSPTPLLTPSPEIGYDPCEPYTMTLGVYGGGPAIVLLKELLKMDATVFDSKGKEIVASCNDKRTPIWTSLTQETCSVDNGWNPFVHPKKVGSCIVMATLREGVVKPVSSEPMIVTIQ